MTFAEHSSAINVWFWPTAACCVGVRSFAGVPVEIISPTWLMLQCLARWTSSSDCEAALAAGPRARVDKAPAPGDYVQVRGREDGTIAVERLRRR